MKKTMLVPALVLATVSAAALPAAAQHYGPSHGRPGYQQPRDDYRGWQSINQRQISLDRRIDVGVRNGQLSRREAIRLRSEFNEIARLEARYRRDGLSTWERNDLDRRFDRLSAQIRYESRDRDGRRR